MKGANVFGALTILQLISSSQAEETSLPLYYAWFINPCDSEFLNNRSQENLKELINIPEFKENYKKFNISSYKEFTSYYPNCNNILHCTAYYCGHGSVSGCEEYHSDIKVKNAILCPYNLEIVGMVVTPRTIGYRIKLNDGEKDIYNQNDIEEEPKSKRSIMENLVLNITTCSINGNPKDWVNSSSMSCVNSVEEYATDDINYQPVTGKGNRAHLTVCTAKDIPAVTTGFDVISVVKAEEDNPEFCKSHSFEISNGMACKLLHVNDTWVIYFKNSLKSFSVFSDM